MTRRLAAVPVAPEDQCLLCGNATDTYLDLCNRCAGVVAAVAERVAASMIGEAPQQIPGQLELDGKDQ